MNSFISETESPRLDKKEVLGKFLVMRNEKENQTKSLEDLMPSIKALILAEKISRNKFDLRYKSQEMERNRLAEEKKRKEEYRRHKLQELARAEEERKLKFLRDVDIPRRE